MEKFCDVMLVNFFGDVIMITSLKWCYCWGRRAPSALQFLEICD